jgi:uncharacterized membrane protein YkvA (DUF1232 family)
MHWSDVLPGVGITIGLIVTCWAVLLVLARRLPPGPVKDLAAFFPDCVTTARRLRRDPRVPRRAKLALALVVLWLVSPIDLIPDVIPVIGLLDDVILTAIALRYAARQVPRSVLTDAWPGSIRGLERLLGEAAPRPTGTGPRPAAPATTDATRRPAGPARRPGEKKTIIALAGRHRAAEPPAASTGRWRWRRPPGSRGSAIPHPSRSAHRALATDANHRPATRRAER